MSSQTIDRVHPVFAVARRLSAELDRLAAVPVWSMGAEDLRSALAAIARDEAQLAALRLRVLAEAERSGAAAASGASTAADWVAVETRQVRREARSDLRLAQALEKHPALEAAFVAGDANAAQARVIVAALARLPSSGEFAVSQEQRAVAEQHLVGLAAHHDAMALRVLGDKLFEVIAPRSRSGSRASCWRHRRPGRCAGPRSRCGRTSRASVTAGSGSRRCRRDG